jgi:hypothetical protein
MIKKRESVGKNIRQVFLPSLLSLLLLFFLYLLSTLSSFSFSPSLSLSFCISGILSLLTSVGDCCMLAPYIPSNSTETTSMTIASSLGLNLQMFKSMIVLLFFMFSIFMSSFLFCLLTAVLLLLHDYNIFSSLSTGNSDSYANFFYLFLLFSFVLFLSLSPHFLPFFLPSPHSPQKIKQKVKKVKKNEK